MKKQEFFWRLGHFLKRQFSAHRTYKIWNTITDLRYAIFEIKNVSTWRKFQSSSNLEDIFSHYSEVPEFLRYMPFNERSIASHVAATIWLTLCLPIQNEKKGTVGFHLMLWIAKIKNVLQQKYSLENECLSSKFSLEPNTDN